MHRNFRFVLVLTLILLVLGLSACSGEHGPNVQVTDVWARQSPKAATSGAAYMRIENKGDEEDALIRVEANVSQRVEIYEMVVDENDVMHLKPVAGQRLVIPAKKVVELKPDGFRVVFIGLHDQLKEGDVVDMTLVFEKSGPISVQAPVKSATAK